MPECGNVAQSPLQSGRSKSPEDEGGIPTWEHRYNAAVFAKQLKRETSHTDHKQNNKQACLLWLPSPSLCVLCAFSPSAPLIKITSSMHGISLQNYDVPE